MISKSLLERREPTEPSITGNYLQETWVKFMENAVTGEHKQTSQRKQTSQTHGKRSHGWT